VKPVIVPFFIPHQGCPHRCVFCDQRAISGAPADLPDRAAIVATVDRWRATAGAAPLEVAFFGGSFTSLAPPLQVALLAPLAPLLGREVSRIRVSTRPDAVTPATLGLLGEYGVDLVELGVQSMDDTVLAAAGRGHLVGDTVTAFGLLRDRGFSVGAQVLPGLPGETPEGALAGFGRLLALGPDLVRIYPALVLAGTELARRSAAGTYRPLSLAAAVDLCKIMLHQADLAGIPVVRVGLQETDGLRAGGTVLAGPYHPALRQLAEGERWYDLAALLLERMPSSGPVTLSVPPARVSDLTGQRRRNLLRLRERFGARVTGVHGDPGLGPADLLITGGGGACRGNLLRDLRYRGDSPERGSYVA
jgi:histone acetyltransferase (RNA polymerase elongator complex component)